MSSSLIPERPLLVSPSLAATIGLEEACMLSLLSEIAGWRPFVKRDGHDWLELGEATLTRLMPFWSDRDIQRISKSLRDKGIILLTSAPFIESRRLCIAFNENKPTTQSKPPQNQALPIINISGKANLIATNWQPDSETLAQIRQLNIDENFTWQQLPEFVIFWRDKGEAHHSWGSKFVAHVKRNWVNYQTKLARQTRELELNTGEREIKMDRSWYPSDHAIEMLLSKANIQKTFVEDAIQEFILYWSGRIELERIWNSKFYSHVSNQWVRYNSSREYTTDPQRIPDNWSPSESVFDVLQLAHIDIEFAKRQIPEFLLYWKESHQLHHSWGSKFLRHVKYQWAKQHNLAPIAQQGDNHAGQQIDNSNRSTRDRSLYEDLTDRSWAD